MRFSGSDDCHRFPHQLSPTQYFPVLTQYLGLFPTLLTAEQEKTSYTFCALLISPLLPKVFLIDSKALALLRYVQMFST